MSIDERYKRNIPTLSEEDMTSLKNACVLVAGCGGLGGFAAELLARAGVGKLKIIDGDVFSVSNLNRQLFSTEKNIGKSKVQCAKERLSCVNADVEVLAVNDFLNEENADEILNGVDLIIDGLDNVESRLVLEEAASKKDITIVHGAVQGDYFQAIIVPPNSGRLKRIYADISRENEKSTLATTVAICAAVQARAAINLICNKTSELENSMLCAAVNEFDFQLIPML